jgi:DNA-binding MarR family transcriptional regulator
MGQVEEDASYIIRSPHRTKVIQRLIERNAIPSQIRDDTGLEYSRITEAANSLRDRSLIELLVSESTKRGRMYGITDRGEEAWAYLVEHNMVDE